MKAFAIVMLAAILALCSSLSAHAATSASLAATLSPDRLGARAMLSITIVYSSGQDGLPAPVRRSVLDLPAGLSLDVPTLKACTPRRLRLIGPQACPPQSRIGGGEALMEVHAGSQLITEKVAMTAFIGFPAGNDPTFEILGQGYSPIQRRVVMTGVALPGSPPYGERLSMVIPAIPTLALEPDASIVRFTLRLGAKPTAHRPEANSVLVPSTCPASGFPFAGEFNYADGSSGRAATTVRCPL